MTQTSKYLKKIVRKVDKYRENFIRQSTEIYERVSDDDECKRIMKTAGYWWQSVSGTTLKGIRVFHRIPPQEAMDCYCIERTFLKNGISCVERIIYKREWSHHEI